MNEVKKPEKDMLEKKCEHYIKIIEEGISFNKMEKIDEEAINKLTEYKKEIENVNTLSEIEKVWFRIFEDKKTRFYESIFYGILDRKQKLLERKIELYPEQVHLPQDKYFIDRAISCKKMLIEGNNFPTVSIEFLRPLKK